MSKDFETHMETAESSMEERENTIMLAASRGLFHPERGKVGKHHSVWNHLLTECGGKIFFSVLARRMTSYMTENSYVDTSVQKGGVPGFSGCVEHTSVISQLIQEAKVNKKDLTVVWLDLANAYGTIPHTLIEESLKHYHIPEHF